jgi:hypothetical protein
MPQWLVKPANQVIAYGDPLRLEHEIGANATPASMLPGRVVIFDDADGTVKEAGAKAHGIVGFLDVAPDKLESDHYAVGDQAMVVKGHCIAKLLLLASENVTRGDKLVTATGGKLAKLATGAMGSQGDVVGTAHESSNVTVDAEILVEWNPSHEPAAAGG